MSDKFWLRKIAKQTNDDYHFEMKCTEKDGGKMILTNNKSGDVNSLKNYDVSSVDYSFPKKDGKIVMARFFYLLLHSHIKKLSAKKIKELKYF